MHNGCSNIYKMARKKAGLTQEVASDLLYISTRSIADYEAGKTTPPDDVVCNMVEVYGTPWLAYQHMKSSSELGRKYLPDIDFSDMARAVLRFQKEVDDLDDIDRQMIDIACDGKIDKTEMSQWQRVEKEVSDVVSAALTVIFCEKEKSAI